LQIARRKRSVAANACGRVAAAARLVSSSRRVRFTTNNPVSLEAQTCVAYSSARSGLWAGLLCPLARGAVRKLGLAYKPDPVGTRCSASVLGFPLRARGSVPTIEFFHSFRGTAGGVVRTSKTLPQKTRRLPLGRRTNVETPQTLKRRGSALQSSSRQFEQPPGVARKDLLFILCW
jgi:hypothetical protein